MELSAVGRPIITSINSFRSVGRIPVFLLLVWITTLWWGERRIWDQSARSCNWHKWENWPSHAEPHHVLLVADPQIVDPHTYPGRPRLLTKVTVWITDQYLRRSYNSLLSHLKPDTTIFLGDLFDGGREWATRQYSSPEEQYQNYDASFWLKEYSRFMDLFVEGWHKQELYRHPSSEGKRIIASLPGNHDLGFAGGIDPYVKSRFDAHFGPLNRIDILGNHSFVSLDTVSLSAMDQIDPVTGSSGNGDGTGTNTKTKDIWMPVANYLHAARDVRSRAAKQRFELLRSKSNSKAPKITPKIPSSLFPTVLLSHVPLFRDADTSCGPFRERGNSIPLAAGYQYQNVLTPLISSEIVKHLDAEEISMIYSGDDHDYCEIEHGEFTGRIKEITVKSTSMAMGVSRPGVQLVSLWNPLDMEKVTQGSTLATDARTPKDTIQNQLCLLPYQQGILLRYAQLLILTIIILAIRATRYKPRDSTTYHALSQQLNGNTISPLLPLSRKLTPPPISSAQYSGDSQPQHLHQHQHTHTHTHSSSSTQSASARSRSKQNGYSTSDQDNYYHNSMTPRSTSPLKHGSGSSSSSIIQHEPEDWGTQMPTTISTNPYSKNTRTVRGVLIPRFLQLGSTRMREFGRSLSMVCVSALSFYLWLIYNG